MGSRCSRTDAADHALPACCRRGRLILSIGDGGICSPHGRSGHNQRINPNAGGWSELARRPGRREQPLDPQAGPLERFALDLRELRERAGLTYTEMADAAHFAASTLSQAAAGHRLPTREVLRAYVRACGGDPD